MSNLKKLRYRALMILVCISSLIYILWRIFFTVPFEYGLVSTVCGIALVMAEAVGVIEAINHYRNMQAFYMPELPDLDENEFLDVDVFIATHSESTSLLYKTINGCKHMRYPDSSKVHIYICDDNDRAEMKELAEKMGIGYLGVRNNRKAKAGNLNNAISKTSSPFIAFFDADMIPTNDFLLQTIPYFYLPYMIKDDSGRWRKRNKEEIDENYKIGFIQTPQSFYNPDLFQTNLFAEQNIPNEQDYFFKEINVGRNKSNSPIFAGSNAVISRKALEDAGGIKENTITEDFATGIEIQSNGYTCYAISKPLVHGLSPNDFESLIRQRQRWGRGCVQTLRNLKFLFSKGLSVDAKLSYFASLLYWWTFLRRFIYIIAPILFTVFGVVVVKTSLLQLLFIWAPSYLIYNRALVVLSGNVRNQKWSNIVDTILFPYLITPIIAESIGLKLNKFFVTSKDVSASRNTKKGYAIPQIVLFFATLVGLSFSLYDMIQLKEFGNIILIYWLVVNGYFLFMSILFMIGRINYRNSERYRTTLPVKILTENGEFNVTSRDISDGGISVIFDFPVYISYNEKIKVSIKYLNYSSEFLGNIVRVNKEENKWVYSIAIREITEENKAEYYQIVYDRHHTLADIINSGVIKDVTTAIKGYSGAQKISTRKLPRMQLNVNVKSDIGNVEIIDFNYECVRIVKKTIIKDNAHTIRLMLDSDFEIICRKLEKNKNLYRIDNWEEIAKSEKLNKFLKRHLYK